MIRFVKDRLGKSSAVRAFAIEAAIVLAIFTTVVFVGLYFRTQNLVYTGVRDEATSYLHLIIATRAWNASHGGVWAVPAPGQPTENPYLRKLGIDATTSTASGTQLELLAPEPMTAEISDFVNRTGDVTFRLTSLKPLDPSNRPTAWEAAVLRGFESDPNQVWAIQRDPTGIHVVRVMRPLFTDAACLRCHRSQGYREGDIRGGMSVTVPLTKADSDLARNAWTLGAIWAVVMFGLGLLLYVLLARMSERVDETEDKLRYIAGTDELTALPNRRAVLERLRRDLARAAREGTSVGVLSIDADRFKQVNDTFGHAAGDDVLRALAARLAGAVREYDAVGRIGGEEFLVIAPEVDAEMLATLGERLRAAVAVVPARWEHNEIAVTVSVGAALWTPERNEDEDAVLVRADRALYRAKEAGRNCVVLD